MSRDQRQHVEAILARLSAEQAAWIELRESIAAWLNVGGRMQGEIDQAVGRIEQIRAELQAAIQTASEGEEDPADWWKGVGFAGE